MMPDLLTLMLLYLITSVINAGSLVVIWGQSRGRFAGISFWLVALALQAVGATLIVLRGMIPDLLSMVLANTVILAGVVILLIGLERFTGKRGRQVQNYVLLAVFIASSAYFAVVQPNQTARDVAVSAMLTIYALQCCWLLLRKTDPGMRPITRLTGIIFAVYAAFSFARIILNIAFPAQSNDFFSSGAVNALTIAGGIGLNVCLTISLILMVNRRLLADVKAQEEKFTTAFRSSPYAITLTRPSDGAIFEVNQSFVNLSGYQSAELIGKTTLGLNLWVHEEDRLAVVNELAQGREIHGAEYPFRKKTGEVLTGLFSASLVTVNNEQCILANIDDITDRKRAEEALRESEEQLRKSNEILQLMFKCVTDGITVTDLSGIITECNEQTVKLHGYLSKDEILGKSAFALIVPVEHEKAMANIHEVLGGGAAINTEHTLLRKDGSQFYGEMSAGVLTDASNNPMGLIAITRDITERKQAEDALRESEERLQRAINANQDGLWEWDIHTNEEYVSPRWCEILGYSFDDSELLHTYDAWASRIHPDDYDRVIEAQRSHLEKGMAYDVDYRHRHRSGEYRWQNSRGQAVMDKLGKPIKMVGCISDITDRKQAEQALRESEEKYRTLFETMTEGVVLLSPDGQISHANPAAERILGTNRAEIEGHPYNSPGWELLCPDGTPMPPEEMAAIFTIGGIRPLKAVEMGFKHSDGLVSWINLNAAPLLDQAGELVGVVGTFRDITDREQLKRETAKKITGQLAAGIAHQIRNPLFIISLSVQSIEKNLPAKDPQRRLTQAILDKVHKLDVITADLVHLGKYHRLQIANASLQQCLEQALILVRAPAKAQRVQVVRRYAANLPQAWIDVEAMDEVFANLFTNALEAMPEGGLLTVETSLDEERKELLARIQDNGCGIPKEALENIFIPFSTTKESGSGLGLVFCQRIVEEHGGRLTFRSEAEGDDHGTIFQIALPLSRLALGRRE